MDEPSPDPAPPGDPGAGAAPAAEPAAGTTTAVRSWAADPAIAVGVSVTVAALAIFGSYLLKRPCTGPFYDQFGVSGNFSLRYQKLCYSDIQQLWVGRGVREHTFPYLDGRYLPGPRGGQLVGGGVEYPVITGVFMWFAGLGAGTDAEYLRLSALLLLPFGLLTTWLLARLAGWRALIWAAAPALVLYGVHNWDFLATACVAGAVLAWAGTGRAPPARPERSGQAEQPDQPAPAPRTARPSRPALAGALLGIGAAIKIYPGFFVLPLLLERLAARDVRGALRVAGAAAGAWFAVNLPIMLANWQGWWATYLFQANREADLTTNSIWYWGLPKLTTDQLNRLTPVLIGLAWLVALAVGWWRARSTDAGYPWLEVSAAMLCAFLLFNKVYSPQYVLWLVPFFVLIRLRWGWWVSYLALDVVLYVGLFRWYYDITRGGDYGIAKQAAIVGVWGKSVLLGLLFVVFLLSRSVTARPAGQPSEVDSRALDGSQAYSASGAPSSTPPAGSSAPEARTTSRSG